MYGDYDAEDRGSRYSFVSSAPGGGNSETSRSAKRQSTLSVSGMHGRGVGGSGGGVGGSFGDAGGGVVTNNQGLSATPPTSVRSASPAPGEAAYPLNDIDYECDPVAVAQEISNLQALRRMSMDVSSAADPDLPSFTSFMPSTPPDDGDPGSVFWVPARLHPELAPQEFSAFLEAKKNEIRRPQSAGGGGGTLSPDGGHSGGPSLRRKKSMLSRQIDANSARNYRDGADRLEKRKSLLTDGIAAPSIQLDDLMKDPTALMHRLSADSRRRTEEGDQVDNPIIFAPKVGLKRSTATHYRRGSTRRGERVGPKRGARTVDTDTEDHGPDAPRGFGLDRASTEPVSLGSSSRDMDEPRQRQDHRSPPDSTSLSTSFDDLAPKAVPGGTPSFTSGVMQEKHKAAPAKARRSSSPRGTTRATMTSEPVPPVPKIVETPPPPPTPPIIELPERHSSFEPPNPSGSEKKQRPPVVNRLSDSIDTTPSAGKAADHMTVPEAKGDKRDRKRSESSGSSSTGKDRKTSWGWLLGDSDKAKEKEETKEREREEKLKAKKGKRPKSADKSSEKYDNTRLDVLQKSIELGNTGKVVAADPIVPAAIIAVEPPSRTDSRESRRSRSEDKKEKEKDSGFLSFFGGSKKKSGSDHSSDHKKGRNGRTRGTSPDPASESQPKFYYARFPIHIERAIYRLSHLKLANPRRPLHQQVLLSNFMYSYLALVQQTQPHLIQQPQTSSSLQQKQHAAEQQRLQEQQRWQQRQEEEARLQQQRQQQDDGARDSDGYVDDSQGYDEYSDDETQAGGNRSNYYDQQNDRDGGNGNAYYDQQQQQRGYDRQQQQRDERDDMW